jgi:hypothetical protein
MNNSYKVVLTYLIPRQSRGGINNFVVFVRSKIKFAFHFTRSLDNKKRQIKSFLFLYVMLLSLIIKGDVMGKDGILRAEIRAQENRDRLIIDRLNPNFHFLLFAGEKPVKIWRQKSIEGNRTIWFALVDSDGNRYQIHRRDNFFEWKKTVTHYEMAPGSFLITDINFYDGSWYIVPRMKKDDGDQEGLMLTGYFETKPDRGNDLWTGTLTTNTMEVCLFPDCVQLLTKDVDYTKPDGKLPANLELGFKHHRDNMHPSSPHCVLPVIIRNLGVQDLKWSSTPQVPWLSLRPDKGVVKRGREILLDLVIDAAGVKPGVYTGTVTITAPDAINVPQDFIVDMTMLKESDPVPPSLEIVRDTFN